MISKLTHQFLRKVSIVPKSKFFYPLDGATTGSRSVIWLPLATLAWYHKYDLETKSESEKMQILYERQEKRVRRLLWFKYPKTAGEKIAAKIHERVGVPFVRKMCELNWQRHLCAFDLLVFFYPKKPNLIFYVVYFCLSLVFMLFSMFISIF